MTILVNDGNGVQAMDMKFLIATHVDYCDASLPVLLPSLIRDNAIPPSDIIVVVGASDDPRYEVKDGVTYRYTRQNSFEHTPLIEVLDEGWSSDYWFLMHDTCRMGPRFSRAVRQADASVGYVSTCFEGWLNMGLFASWFLEEARGYILSLKDCSKNRAIMSEKMYCRMTKSASYETDVMQNLGTADMYGSPVKRRVIYFPNADVYKYQANYPGTDALNKVISV
jgi:hypothetical protein